MKLEVKIMADRARQDFVKVQLKAGFGSAKIECGPFCFAFEAGKPLEVTRAEWNELLKDRGILEEVNPQISQIAQKGREKQSAESA